LVPVDFQAPYVFTEDNFHEISYLVILDPLVFTPDHVRELAPALVAFAMSEVGPDGLPAGVTELEGADGSDSLFKVEAITVN
jgi:hypothetical protein